MLGQHLCFLETFWNEFSLLIVTLNCSVKYEREKMKSDKH